MNLPIDNKRAQNTTIVPLSTPTKTPSKPLETKVEDVHKQGLSALGNLKSYILGFIGRNVPFLEKLFRTEDEISEQESVSEHVQKLEVIQSQVSRAKQEISELDETYESKLSEIKVKKEFLSQQLDEARNTHPDRERELLLSEQTKIEEGYDKLEQAISTYEKEMNALGEVIVYLETKITNVNKELSAIETELTQKEKSSLYEAELPQIRKKIANKKEELQQIQSECSQFKVGQGEKGISLKNKIQEAKDLLDQKSEKNQENQKLLNFRPFDSTVLNQRISVFEKELQATNASENSLTETYQSERQQQLDLLLENRKKYSLVQNALPDVTTFTSLAHSKEFSKLKQVQAKVKALFEAFDQQISGHVTFDFENKKKGIENLVRQLNDSKRIGEKIKIANKIVEELESLKAIKHEAQANDPILLEKMSTFISNFTKHSSYQEIKKYNLPDSLAKQVDDSFTRILELSSEKEFSENEIEIEEKIQKIREEITQSQEALIQRASSHQSYQTYPADVHVVSSQDTLPQDHIKQTQHAIASVQNEILISTLPSPIQNQLIQHLMQVNSILLEKKVSSSLSPEGMTQLKKDIAALTAALKMIESELIFEIKKTQPSAGKEIPKDPQGGEFPSREIGLFESQNNRTFQSEFLLTYRPYFISSENKSDSTQLFEYFNREFKTASFSKQREILLLAKQWLDDPMINDGDLVNKDVYKEVEALFDQVAAIDSPLLKALVYTDEHLRQSQLLALQNKLRNDPTFKKQHMGQYQELVNEALQSGSSRLKAIAEELKVELHLFSAKVSIETHPEVLTTFDPQGKDFNRPMLQALNSSSLHLKEMAQELLLTKKLYVDMQEAHKTLLLHPSIRMDPKSAEYKIIRTLVDQALKIPALNQMANVLQSDLEALKPRGIEVTLNPLSECIADIADGKITGMDKMNIVIQLAKDLRIADAKLFVNIPSSDFPNSPNDTQKILPLSEIGKYYTMLGSFVSNQILAQGTPEKRAKVIEFFIDVEYQLLNLDPKSIDELQLPIDFNAAYGIHTGIETSVVTKLTTTFEKILNKRMDRHEEVKQIFSMGTNFSALRAKMEEARKAELPFIPLIYLFSKDYTLADENKTFRKDRTPNTDKIQIQGNSLMQFKRLQTTVAPLTQLSTINQIDDVIALANDLDDDARFVRAKELKANSQSNELTSNKPLPTNRIV